jgi:hypothetical protein
MFHKPTDEMVQLVYERIDFVNHGDDGIREGLAAVLAIAERDLRARIAYRIRAELVCCDIYERDHDTDRAGRTHAICFWGEAGARIAERGPL